MGVENGLVPHSNLGRIFRKDAITQSAWDMLKVTDPEVVARYYHVPLSFVVQAAGDDETQAYRSQISLIDVVEQRFGFVGGQRKMVNRAASLGLSLLPMITFAEATIQCIAEDTKIDIPRRKFSTMDKTVAQIRNAVDAYNTLLEVRENNADLGKIESTVLSYALEGLSDARVAQMVTFDMQLDTPLKRQQVYEILQSLLNKEDHRRNVRIAERRVKARGVLEAEERGTFYNAHAALAEKILLALDRGDSAEEIYMKLNLIKDQYKAVMGIVVQDLLRDPEGAKAIEGIIEKLGLDQYPSAVKHIIAVHKELLEPYRAFRVSLGEEMHGAKLTTTRLSPLEKGLVNGAVEGRYDKDIAKDIKLSASAVTEAMNILFEERKLRTPSSLDHEKEREKVWHLYCNSNQLLPIDVASLKGYPAPLFLGFLQEGRTYSEICHEINVAMGTTLIGADLSRWFAKIRAYYKKIGKLDGRA